MKKTVSTILCLMFLMLGLQAYAEGDIKKQIDEGKAVKVNKEQFMKYIYNFEKSPQEWIYEGKKPCIIDFYADWCGPCRKLAPIMSSIASKYKGEVIVYKVDTEAQRDLAAFFGIKSLPTIVFVPVNGTPQAAMGLMPEEDIEKYIESVLGINKVVKKDI